jgi:hypothetical protein
MTKKLLNEIWEGTNECFKQALLQVYPDVLNLPEHQRMNDTDLKVRLVEAGLPFKSKDINDAYVAELKLLSSEQISLIIEADTKKKIHRSPITIHALMDELFERAANPETKDTK